MKGIARSLSALMLMGSLAAVAAPPQEGASGQQPSALRAAAGTHRLLLLGEMHGTKEAPAFASRVVADYAADGPVTLVLEIHATEQAGIDRYLGSKGTEADRAQLLSGKFWQVPLAKNDGRRNAGALALIEDLRRLREAGRKVSVLAMDPGDLGGNQSRDDAMAAFIRSAFGRMQAGRMIVLTGNVHAMRAKPQFAPAEMQQPMGSRLSDLDLYSVNLDAGRGKFWACAKAFSDCGPKDMHPTGLDAGVQSGAPWDYNVLLPEYSIPKMVGEGKVVP